MIVLGLQDAQTAPIVAGLNDIVAPAPVSMTPQTVGWAVLAAMAVLALAAAVLLARRRYVRNAYRREALAALERTPLVALPALVKRVALAAAPRPEVAALTGEVWLAFLDRTYGGDGFTKGAGRALASLSFDPAAADEQSAAELRRLVALWIGRHRV